MSFDVWAFLVELRADRCVATFKLAFEFDPWGVGGGSEMLKGLGDLASLMKQATQMKGMVSEMQEKLGRVRVTGAAGGGMVEVEMSGHQKVVACSISEKLSATDDRELIEDLVVAATNQAMEKVREAAAAEMGELAGGLDVPGLGDALAQFSGGEGPAT